MTMQEMFVPRSSTAKCPNDGQTTFYTIALISYCVTGVKKLLHPEELKFLYELMHCLRSKGEVKLQ